MAYERSFAKLGAPLSELQAAAADRLQDAEALFSLARCASAIAMGVYSLEIHLKVRICQKLDLHALPSAFEIHDLEGLLVLCGLRKARNSASAVVRKNWDEIVDRSSQINQLRYQPSSNWTQAHVQTFFEQLRDPPDGVLPWLLAQP
jgi:3'-phosphoadenosine 5'-phosphosulfate sulfotransferase (PAPS reductase)/FAD synthetase